MGRVPGVATTQATYHAFREWKSFASSTGSRTRQVVTHVGASLEVNAASGDELQRRTYPESGGGYRAAGYEHVRGLDLASHGRAPRRGGRRAPQRARAAAGPADDRPPPVAALPPDPRELRPPDRARPRLRHRGRLRGHELPDDRQARRRASATAPTSSTIVADATTAGGLGTFGWDDEGVPAQRVPPRRRPASSAGYLTSRETAPRIGRRSGGAMRADGWNRIPLIRMTNINLAAPRRDEPRRHRRGHGRRPPASTSNRSWSIDDRRLNFQFGCEVAREIRGGKLGRLYRNATYTGITPGVLALVRRGRGREHLDARRASRTAARASPTRGCTSATAAAGRGSATSRWASARGEPCPAGSRSPSARSRWRSTRGATQAEALVMHTDERAHAVRRTARSTRTSRRRTRSSTSASSTGGGSGSRPATGPTTMRSGGSATPRPPSPGSSPRTARSRRCRPRCRPRSCRAAWSQVTADASPESRADAVAAIVAAAKARGRGRLRALPDDERGGRVVNSLGRRGHRAAQRRAAPHGDDGPGWRHGLRRAATRSTSRELDAAAVGREAAAEGARDGRPGRAAARRLPGRPRAVRGRRPRRHARLPRASPALAVQEERSFFEPGRRIGSPLVSLIDDATDPAGTPASFDYEGVPTRRVTLLEAGVCREVVHDAQTAARDGVRLHGPRAAGAEPVGSVPAPHGHGGRHDAARGRSSGASSAVSS